MTARRKAQPPRRSVPKRGSHRPIVRTVPEPRKPAELVPLGEEAFHGLAGEIVRAIEPHSEADPAAILVQFLAAVGNAIGSGPCFRVEADRHPCNLFVAIVGETASARKGSSWGQARRLVEQADPEWADRIKNGASSGEGLIAQVRDAAEDGSDGIEDKRLLVVETELASVLERMSNSGNMLSHVLRQAWDGGKLDTLVKRDRVTATKAHVSLIGHITVEELRRKLTATEQANGFANRIWVYAKHSKSLPFGGDLESVDWTPFVNRLDAVLSNHTSKRLGFTQEARVFWGSVYEELSTPPPGLLGPIIARGPSTSLAIRSRFGRVDLRERSRRSDRRFASCSPSRIAQRHAVEGSPRRLWKASERRGDRASASRLGRARACLLKEGALSSPGRQTLGWLDQ